MELLEEFNGLLGNLELFVKVLSVCRDPFNAHWVYAGGATDLGVRIDVCDTAHGQLRFYESVDGRAFATVSDTAAFRCQ